MSAGDYGRLERGSQEGEAGRRRRENDAILSQLKTYSEEKLKISEIDKGVFLACVGQGFQETPKPYRLIVNASGCLICHGELEDKATFLKTQILTQTRMNWPWPESLH